MKQRIRVVPTVIHKLGWLMALEQHSQRRGSSESALDAQKIEEIHLPSLGGDLDQACQPKTTQLYPFHVDCEKALAAELRADSAAQLSGLDECGPSVAVFGVEEQNRHHCAAEEHHPFQLNHHGPGRPPPDSCPL
eukprot:TRINITY_DN4677_c0_g1_i1.p2 TRINITY_DN4677_c0_g1~~TRINITY_DN4677_c0_g1_i1.p2  ORF type:complete len:135 (+),score=17.62 TRINITY_DN4677_c0_g1_i1:238-642(+)